MSFDWSSVTLPSPSGLFVVGNLAPRHRGFTVRIRISRSTLVVVAPYLRTRARHTGRPCARASLTQSRQVHSPNRPLFASISHAEFVPPLGVTYEARLSCRTRHGR